MLIRVAFCGRVKHRFSVWIRGGVYKPAAPEPPIVFSYLMVAGAIDWNICPEVLSMTKGQMFQSIALATIK